MADKEEIRDRSDIVDIIGTFVPLRKRGRNHLGLCPFHQEKTPSFNVDPQTGTYHCFGCGEHGDVFSFVEKYQNMDFLEAADFLARRAGLTFDRKGRGSEHQVSERGQIFAVNTLAAKFFRGCLDKAKVARDYLESRGLTHETIGQFQLGFAPDDWDALTGHLRVQKQDLKLAVNAGLIRPNTSGDYFDVFRNRIIFPILDEQARIVGFGGRAFGDDQPKYLNTGETPVFVKSRLLYGLTFARRKIASEQTTLLMEGYTDVIAAHQAGFSNAVATLGTSLTDEHAKKLARLAPENPTVILVYDADSAGIKATLRAGEMLEGEGVRVRVARLPAGDDPDSMLKRGEIASFQRVLDEALGRVDYQIERIIQGTDQSTGDGKTLMLRKIVAILASVPTRSERDVYVNKVWKHHPMSSHGPSVATEQLHQDAEAYAAKVRKDKPRSSQSRLTEAPPKVQDNQPTAILRAERELIRALADPTWRHAVLQAVSREVLPTEIGTRFYAFVRARADILRADNADLVAMLNREEDQEFCSAILQQLQESNLLSAKVPISQAAIDGCARTLRRNRVLTAERERAQLLQDKAVWTEEDKERLVELQKLLAELKGSDKMP